MDSATGAKSELNRDFGPREAPASGFTDFLTPKSSFPFQIGHRRKKPADGIAATGRKVEFTGMVIYRIECNEIAGSWGEIDFLRLMRQLR